MTAAKVNIPSKQGDGAELAMLPSVFRCTDSGNAERFAARYRNDVRWVSARRKWIVWSGTHWEWDETHQVELRAKDMARAITNEARNTPDLAERKVLFEWSAKSESAGKRAACLELARAEPGITIKLDRLDADPWLLNCSNGTLNLRTGELHSHRREDLITKTTGTAYNPGAGTFLWETVLQNMTGGDKELESYLQRVAGYSLAGIATERKFFFLYGPPGSGKSTFIEALLSCMGAYAVATPFDTWLERPQVGGNRDDLVELQGVRLVTSGEVSASKHWDTAILKKITGGDRITASAKYEKQVSYLPSCTLIFAANDAPKAREDDSGFWERMQRVPITNVVLEKNRIKDLHAQLREPEHAEAILAWAVKGCRDWQDQGGIGTAKVVSESSSQYREENDWIGGFLEQYVIEDGAVIPAAQFRAQYEEYCKQEGQKPEATKTLARKIEKRTANAVRYVKLRGARMWQGLMLGSSVPAHGSLGLEPPDGRFDDEGT